MDIKISKSARICRESERDFVHGELVYSVVRIQDKELVREDFCAEHWIAARARDAYSHWSTKYVDPRVAEQEPAEAFSPLRQLFYEAVEAEERVDQAKAFLAAQLLRRQKVFRQIKESDESDGEVKIVLFNDRIGNRLIEVRDPNFSYAELEQGRLLLVARLRELEAPEKPEAEAAPSETVAAASEDDDDPKTAVADDSSDDDLDDTSDDSTGDDDDDSDSDDIDADDEDDDDEEYDDDEFEDDDDDEDDEYDDDEDDDDEVEDVVAEESEAEEEKSTKHV